METWPFLYFPHKCSKNTLIQYKELEVLSAQKGCLSEAIKRVVFKMQRCTANPYGKNKLSSHFYWGFLKTVLSFIHTCIQIYIYIYKVLRRKFFLTISTLGVYRLY